MKNLSILLVALLGIATKLAAQGDTTIPDFDSVAFTPNPCKTPYASYTTTVFYGTTATGYVNIDTPTVAPFYYQLYYLGSSVGSPVQATNGHLIFNNLEVNKEYIVKTTNTCASLVDVAIINTTLAWDTSTVLVSDKMFNHISSWLRNPYTNLYNYIAGLPDVHYLEKTATLQQWYLEDTLPRVTQGQIPSRAFFNFNEPPPIPTTDATCDCKFVMTAKPNYSKGIKKTIIDDPSWEKQGDLDNFTWQKEGDGWVNGSKLWKGENVRGASKYQQSRTQGTSSSHPERDDVWEAGSPNGASSYYGVLRVSQVCSDYNPLPIDCACEREINVEYTYDTKLETWSKITSGLGERKGSAEVEDFAIVVAASEKSQAISILDAGRAKAQATANKDRNDAFIRSILGISANVTKIVVNWNTMTPNGIIDSIADVIEDIFQIPSSTVGSFSDHTVEGTLVHGNKTLMLKGNDPLFIYLFSASLLKVTGLRNSHSNARLESSFALSLRHNPGTVPGSPHCCGPVFGAWVIGGSATTPIPLTNLKSKVEDHLAIWPSWGPSGISVDHVWGVKRGPYNPNCETTVETLPAPTGNTTPLNGVEVRVANNNIIVVVDDEKQRNNKNIYTFEVYTADGKLLSKGELNSSQQIYELKSGYSAGIYFVRIVSNGEGKTYKIAVVN